MRRIWKKAFSGATALLVCMSSAASQFDADSIVFAAEEPTVEIGTVCLTLEELKANDYQVSVPVTVSGTGGYYLLSYFCDYDPAEITLVEFTQSTAFIKAKAAANQYAAETGNTDYAMYVNDVSAVNNDEGFLNGANAVLRDYDGSLITDFDDGVIHELLFEVSDTAETGDIIKLDNTLLPLNGTSSPEIGLTSDVGTVFTPTLICGAIIITESEGVIASGVCGETDVSWVLDTEGTLTLSGTGSHGSYAPWLTNYRNDIERVVIESGVTNVGYSAFGQCPNLKNVTIADTVTEIDDYAFYGCEKLTEIVIPDSVTSVGDYAFIDCTSLEEIVIPENVTSLGTQAFNGCDALTDIYFINPDCEIYDSAKSLPESAVLYGSAGSTAEAYAYTYDREFVEYTLIASGACGDRGSNVTWKLDSAGKLIVSGNGDMADYKWEDKTELVEYDNVYTPWCEYRDVIKSVVFEEGVTRTGDFSFYFCESLSSFSLADSVNYIGHHSFYACDSLKSVFIPDTVSFVAYSSFGDCQSLEEILVSETHELYDSADGVLFYKDMTELVQYPAGKKDTSYIIPEGVWNIYGGSFGYSTNLKSVVFPDTVTRICNNAFRGCASLTSVVIPDSVTSFDYSLTFASCTSLTSIILSDNLTNISRECFVHCTSLKSVVVPDSVTKIDRAAFYNCTSLTDVSIMNPDCVIDSTSSTIPSTVTIHGFTDSTAQAYAETNGNPFVEITVLGSGECGAEGSNVTWKLDSLGNLTISGTGDMADYTNGTKETRPWHSLCNNVKNVIIKDGVTSIGDYTTYGFNKAESIKIADSVTDIGRSAFEYWFKLKTVTIPENVKTIGWRAFCYTTGLTDIIVDDDNTVYSDSDGILFRYDETELVAYPAGRAGTSYEIPDTVKKLGSYSIYATVNLAEVTLSDSVVSLGDGVFIESKALEAIYVNDGNEMFTSVDGILFDKAMRTLWSYPPMKSDTVYSIPTSVKTIKRFALYNCDNLTDIIIPESVEYVGNDSLRSCDRLSTVVLPRSVTFAGGWTFAYDSGLTDVYILNPDCEFEFLKTPTFTVIHGYSGSTAETYAAENSLTFEPISITASGECGSEGDNVTWSLDELGNLYISGTGDMADFDYMDVPWYDNRDFITNIYIADGVTGIGEWVFYNCRSLTSITVPETVARIGYNAFKNCDYLEEITILNPDCDIYDSETSIPSNITIRGISGSTAEAYAELYGNTFVDITIIASGECGADGDNVTWTVDRLGNLTISGTGRMADYTWENKSYVANYGGVYTPWCEYRSQIKEIVVEAGVTSLGTFAFSHCHGITEFEIPESVTEICYSALWDCDGLETITIPATVTSIPDNPFSCCDGLTAINVSEDSEYFTSIDGVLFTYDKKTLIDYPIGKTETTYEIPSHVTTVMSNAFRESDYLESISIPEGVESIGRLAFFGCEKLKSVTIPESVTAINQALFRYCYGLERVELHNKIALIGEHAFEECTALTELLIENPDCEIFDLAVTIPSTITIHGYAGSTAEAYAAKYGNTFEPIEILASGECGAEGDNLTWLLDEFGNLVITGTGDMEEYETDVDVPWYDYRDSIKALDIADGVTSIGRYAFFRCENLAEVDIPESVKVIGGSAFIVTEWLTQQRAMNVHIPLVKVNQILIDARTISGELSLGGNGITSIGDSAFYNNPYIISVSLSEYVGSIYDFAFFGCEALKCVTILDPECEIYDSGYCIPEEVAIEGYAGSTAEAYAEKYGNTFIPLEQPDTSTTTTITTTAATTTTTTTTTETAPITTTAPAPSTTPAKTTAASTTTTAKTTATTTTTTKTTTTTTSNTTTKTTTTTTSTTTKTDITTTTTKRTTTTLDSTSSATGSSRTTTTATITTLTTAGPTNTTNTSTTVTTKPATTESVRTTSVTSLTTAGPTNTTETTTYTTTSTTSDTTANTTASMTLTTAGPTNTTATTTFTTTSDTTTITTLTTAGPTKTSETTTTDASTTTEETTSTVTVTTLTTAGPTDTVSSTTTSDTSETTETETTVSTASVSTTEPTTTESKTTSATTTTTTESTTEETITTTTSTTETTTTTTVTTEEEHVVSGEAGGVSYSLSENGDDGAVILITGNEDGTELDSALWTKISKQLKAGAEYSSIEMIIENVVFDKSTFASDESGILGNVTSVVFADAETIPGNPAFQKFTALEEVTVSASLRSIEPLTFFRGIKAVNLICNGNTYCIAGEDIEVTDELISAVDTMQLESVGMYAFYDCPLLNSFIIPEGAVLSDKSIGFNSSDDGSSEYINESLVIYGWEGSSAQEYAEKHDAEFTAVTSAASSKGDVNVDGSIDIDDASMALTIYARKAAGLSIDEYSEAQMSNADVDDDGAVTIDDAAAILVYYARKAAGLDASF